MMLKTFKGSEHEYIELIKKHFSHNATSFVSGLRRLEKTKFIEHIESQFTYYMKEKSGNAEKWLSITKDTIVNGGLGVYKVYDIVLRAAFIEWHDLKTNELSIKPQEPQPEPTKKEMHNNIFKGKAFELWEYYKDCKNVGKTSRTDLRFLFELMKADNLLVDTVELKHYITWLNKYFDTGGIEQLKKIDIKASSNTQRTKDYNEYKKTTLK
jgi:hypothetical protein